jgi:hypothetical protein
MKRHRDNDRLAKRAALRCHDRGQQVAERAREVGALLVLELGDRARDGPPITESDPCALFRGRSSFDQRRAEGAKRGHQGHRLVASAAASGSQNGGGDLEGE